MTPRPFVITRMFAFLAVGDDGEEGVVSLDILDRGAFPLVAADEDRVNALRPIAQDIADRAGLTIQLVAFDNRRNLETINPEGAP